MNLSIPGYPSIGPKRELKFVLEKFWRGEISEYDLETVSAAMRKYWFVNGCVNSAGSVPVGTFSYYDRMLDTAVLLGVLPKRYTDLPVTELEQLFAAARGWSNGDITVAPLAMKKWFNTNYHYIVPELDETSEPALNDHQLWKEITEAKEEGLAPRPVVIGPVTFVQLSRCNGISQSEIFQKIIPIYTDLLASLKKSGIDEIQIDEPVLVTETVAIADDQIKACYAELSSTELPIYLNTYFDSLTNWELVTSLPVAKIGIDFVAGEESLTQLEQNGFPTEKTLVAGIIDGRNIWKSSPLQKRDLINDITAIIPEERVELSTSCSLLHVPYTVEFEEGNKAVLAGVSFAVEKCRELEALANNDTVIQEKLQAEYNSFVELNAKHDPEVRARVQREDSLRRGRAVPFAERRGQQKERLALPALPTTTIGSFPQTKEVRNIRRDWKLGSLENESYELFIEEKIKECIAIQEELGLDVLVHGEFERNDMVEYFGEKLNGFHFTKFGWVQSYGSRCVKPPLLYGDVSRSEPITVKETVYANCSTEKPVKGMLTGPITILNWSFVRDDITWFDVGKQVAAAIADEVIDLEQHGISIIQVDEAALREGVPLKKKSAEEYLQQSVDLFQRTVEKVQPETQIHTHMCYSEFADITDTIIGFDADVITVECTRDGGSLYSSLGGGNYLNHIGPGIYDIHSPLIPAVEEYRERIATLLNHFPEEQLWINPDCGLKTRGWKEVVPALKNMVEAVKTFR